MEAPLTVRIAVGPRRSLLVRGDDNIVPLVRTTTHDGTLTISVRRSFESAHGLSVSIETPRLERVALSGVGTVDVAGVHGSSFGAELTGTGAIAASGRVQRLDVEVSGAGEARLDELAAREVEVDVTGTGSARVNASRSLDAKLSGVGSIRYRGRPTILSREISGVGVVAPL